MKSSLIIISLLICTAMQAQFSAKPTQQSTTLPDNYRIALLQPQKTNPLSDQVQQFAKTQKTANILYILGLGLTAVHIFTEPEDNILLYGGVGLTTVAFILDRASIYAINTPLK